MNTETATNTEIKEGGDAQDGGAAAAPAPAPAPNEPATSEEAIAAALGATVGDEDAGDEGGEKGPGEAAKPDGNEGGGEKKGDAPGSAAAPAAAPQDDPYAMPDDLSDRAQARFKELAGRARDGEAWKERAEQWQQTVESTGASPDQFGQLLTYSSLVNSGDPAKLRQAMAVLEQERATLARALGEEVPGVDLLAAHPDLLERVGSGDMERASALELVRARDMAASSRQQQERWQADQLATQVRQQAVDGLNAMGNQLAAQDPQYTAKYAAMQPMLPIIAQLPPAQWSEAFMTAYRAVVVPAAAPATAPAQRLPQSPQPLRGTNGGGATSLQQQATTAQQAIEQALGMG